MIQIKNISKRYKTITALDDVSLVIKPGEFFGLLGPNGAGKSTLMNLLAGYIEADKGSITFKNDIVSRESLHIRKKFGLAPQSLALYEDLSAEANLKIFGGLYNVDKDRMKASIEDKLYTAGLYERRKDLVKTFSGGMKRRLNLIAALLHEPKVLLCDEPTVGIDPQSRNAIFDYLLKINKEGITVIYTTHYMEEAERLCKKIAIIDFGKIIALGTKDELLDLLPYKEEIFIEKNTNVTENLNLLGRFGEVITKDDKYEIKLNEESKLSDVFKILENSGINYRNVEFQNPSLEELFLNLTGRRLRD
ncbi:MAG: ABC transporter ATP-binding protein [Ignavibacteria bacterium]|jgi:ABC-2 type transport system ATP-binding protein